MILGALSAQAALVKSALRLQVSASMVSGITLLLAGIFVLFAMAFGAAALFFALEEDMSPTGAALWVALLALFLAVLAWLIGVLIARPRRRAAKTAMTAALSPLTAAGLAASPRPPAPRGAGAPPPPPNTHAMMLDHGMEVGARAHAAMAAHPVGLLAAGLGMGLVVGFSPGLRRGIRRMLPW